MKTRLILIMSLVGQSFGLAMALGLLVNPTQRNHGLFLTLAIVLDFAVSWSAPHRRAWSGRVPRSRASPISS